MFAVGWLQVVHLCAHLKVSVIVVQRLRRLFLARLTHKIHPNRRTANATNHSEAERLLRRQTDILKGRLANKQTTIYLQSRAKQQSF